jgi:hypothetical protein
MMSPFVRLAAPVEELQQPAMQVAQTIQDRMVIIITE